MEESVSTLCHSLIRQAVSLDRAKYEIVRNSILKVLLAYGAMTPEQLGSMVKSRLRYKNHGSLQQYYEAVRQDLEARGEIRCAPGSGPLLLELAM